jgi:hypothetical protein
MRGDGMLFLFASNLRPRYEQDIRDILALPQGMLWHLRYLRHYVSPEAQKAWETLSGQTVLVNYSLQQAAQYHDAAFVPVRLGRVSSTSVEGNFWFVQFTLEDYISLPQPTGDGTMSSWVRTYGQYLRRKGIEIPYSYWVSVGDSIIEDESAPIDTQSDPTSLFERTTTYLHATSSFEATCFARFLRLTTRAAHANSDEIPFEPATQSFRLVAGHSYDLQLLFSQPGEVMRARYSIDVDNTVIYALGRPELEIASRYDLLTIRLHAPLSEGHETKEALLTLEPQPGTTGPRLRLPLKVRPSQGRTWATALGTVLALVTLGSPAFISNSFLILKLTLLILGALTTAALRVFRLGR